MAKVLINKGMGKTKKNQISTSDYTTIIENVSPPTEAPNGGGIGYKSSAVAEIGDRARAK